MCNRCFDCLLSRTTADKRDLTCHTRESRLVISRITAGHSGRDYPHFVSRDRYLPGLTFRLFQVPNVQLLCKQDKESDDAAAAGAKVREFTEKVILVFGIKSSKLLANREESSLVLGITRPPFRLLFVKVLEI